MSPARGSARNAAIQAQAGVEGVVLDDPAAVPAFSWPLAYVPPVIGFVTYGQPAPQGSKRIAYRGGKATVKEASDSLGPWRDSVKHMAKKAVRAWAHREGRAWVALDCPVVVQAVITMPASAEAERKRLVFPTGTPDVDKLERAIGDALSPTPVSPSEVKGLPPNTAKRVREEMLAQRRATCVLHDDSRIVAWDARKVFPATTVDSLAHPGAVVRVWRAADLLAWRPQGD